MPQGTIQRAIGPRAEVRLRRAFGGTPVYARQAKRNCTEIKAAEGAAMERLFELGYTKVEIARVFNRCVGSVRVPRRHIWNRPVCSYSKVARALAGDEAACEDSAHLVEGNRLAHVEYLLEAAATAERRAQSLKRFGETCADTIAWAEEAAETLRTSASGHLMLARRAA